MLLAALFNGMPAMSQVVFAAELCRAVWRDRRASEKHLREFQAKRLNDLIQHAAARVPFQAERLRKAGMGSARDTSSVSLEKFSEIAPVDKSEMMRKFQETITDRSVTIEEVHAVDKNTKPGSVPWLRNQYLLSKTSGTTGTAGWFLNDGRSWAIQRAAVMARTIRDRLIPSELARFAFGRRYRMGFLVTDCPFSVSGQSAATSKQTGWLFASIRTISIRDSVDQTIKKLNAFRPHFLHSYPTYLEMIAVEKLAGKEVRFSPEIISVGSEPLLPTALRVIKQAFPKAMLTNQYGSTECIPLGNQCSAGRMHLNTDYVLIEPTERSGAPTPRNQFSDHILITNLVNKFQPIIRYRIDDSIRIQDEPCECGRSFPVFELRGRNDSVLDLLNDLSEWITFPPLGIVTVMLNIEGLAQFQVLHEAQNVLRIRCIPINRTQSNLVTASAEAEFTKFLRQNGCGRSVCLNVESVEEIPRIGDGGKARQIVSLVERKGCATDVHKGVQTTKLDKVTV